MIDATVVNSDPVPSRARPASPRSALPPISSKAASYGPGGIPPEPMGVSLGVPPGAVGSPEGVGVVPGGVVGEGFGIGEDV
jgi:hypothetical protein